MIGHQIKNLPRCLPPTLQSKLNLRTAGGRRLCAPRPLGDMNAAMRDLDLGELEILELLERRVLIGFDISVDPLRRGELRFLTRSLEHFRRNEGRAAPQIAWPDVFRLIFPVSTPAIPPSALTGLELKQGLNCSRGHVENLASRYFQVLRPARAGRGNTPQFTAASVELWLKNRML